MCRELAHLVEQKTLSATSFNTAPVFFVAWSLFCGLSLNFCFVVFLGVQYFLFTLVPRTGIVHRGLFPVSIDLRLLIGFNLPLAN